jgi:glycerophosphoryl diester phosphodiesterase
VPALSYRRVGHKGADHLAPGNTRASFDAALAAGVDMIEFDVLPEHTDGSGELLLAHDYEVLGRRAAPTLAEGLAHLASATFAEIAFDVDMKLAGYELRVVDALREHGLDGRTLVTTMETESLPIVRTAAPDIRLGWSVPKVRRNYLANPFTRPGALALAAFARHFAPARLARAVAEHRVEAIMCHHQLVTARMVDAVLGAGGELYVWTVDDRPTIDRLAKLGVTGIISNDPRLFWDDSERAGRGAEAGRVRSG